jgi:hypothetical protein
MNLAGFDAWVKNKAHNGVFNLKQLLDNMFPEPEIGEIREIRAESMRELFIWWDTVAKGLSKMATKIIPWREEKLEKWLRVFGPCQLLWIPKSANVVTLKSIKKTGGTGRYAK